MPKCPKCGNLVQPDDVFCENCGHSLQQSQRPVQSSGRSGLELPPGIGSWKTLRWVMAGMLGALLISGLCGAFVSLRVLGQRAPEVVEKPVLATQVVRVVVTATPLPKPTDTPGPTPTSTLTPTPSDTPTITPTFTPTDAPTNTPTRTETPSITPSATHTPTATPVPDTEPGTILEPGETWYEDGLSLWLDVSTIQAQALVVDAILENLSAGYILVEGVKGNNFRMVTNTGDSIFIYHETWKNCIWDHRHVCDPFSLQPGERKQLLTSARFEYDLANPSITHVIIEAVGISRIKKARWRVEIPH